MKDIVQEARELLDYQKITAYFYADDVQGVIRGLIERIQELEQERDAVFETLRLVRLDKSVNKFDVLMAEAKRDTANEMRLRMMEEMQKARGERDVALERVRVLEEASRGVIYRGGECGMGVKMGAITDFNIAFMGLESVLNETQNA